MYGLRTTASTCRAVGLLDALLSCALDNSTVGARDGELLGDADDEYTAAAPVGIAILALVELAAAD
jgi:hypothetical protein